MEPVSSQVQWLCERGGFATLKSKAYSGQGVAAITEFFAEYDKTLYYASGFSLPGGLAKIATIPQLFCDDFESLRLRLGGLGLESVKSIKVSTKDSDSCEYLQESVPEWGVRTDIKALASYGFVGEGDIIARIDGMIAPLNYSAVKQYSSLILIWEVMPGRIEGVYLIKSQVNVPGSLMGAARSRLKASITSTIEGYAKFLAEKFASQEKSSLQAK